MSQVGTGSDPCCPDLVAEVRVLRRRLRAMGVLLAVAAGFMVQRFADSGTPIGRALEATLLKMAIPTVLVILVVALVRALRRDRESFPPPIYRATTPSSVIPRPGDKP